jgi:hypothetical protein
MLDGAEGAALICPFDSTDVFISALPLSSWIARFAMPTQIEAANAVAIKVTHMARSRSLS